MPRGKTPKIKVLHPRINILGLKNLHLLEFALSVARKATEQHTASRKVNCSLSLRLQAKTAPNMKSQFLNMEDNYAAAQLQQQCCNQCCCAVNASTLMFQPERTVPEKLAPARAPNASSTT